MLSFTITSHTEQNESHRPEQSDRFLVLPFEGGVLAAVMDGVGCFKYGDVAAQSVVDSFKRYNQINPAALRVAPKDALEGAMSQAREDLLGLLGATTCTAMLFLETGRVQVAHIGDSAAFRCRGGLVRQLTHPDRHGRHVLSHALHGEPEAGWRASTVWKCWKLYARPGDVYLLATDGCSDEISPMLLHRALAGFSLPSDVVSNPAEQLVRASLAAGSKDNSTAIVVRVEAS